MSRCLHGTIIQTELLLWNANPHKKIQAAVLIAGLPNPKTSPLTFVPEACGTGEDRQPNPAAQEQTPSLNYQ